MSWGKQYEARKQIERRYKTVFRLPIARKLAHILTREIPTGSRVLDVGAGDRKVKGLLPDRTYLSADPDSHTKHDYASLEAAEGPFDAILFLEVIEHVSPEEALSTLQRFIPLLAPGGVVVVSTPNTFHPPAYLRDATHRTPFCYDELGGILTVAGFESIQLSRVYNDAIWRKFLRRYAFGWLFRLLNLDFAPQVVAVARRPTM